MASVPLVVERDPDDPDCANLLVDGTVGGVRRRFVLDTGATRTHLVAGHGLEFETLGVESGYGGVFGAADQQLARVHDLRVGPVVIDSLTVTVGPEEGAGRDLLGVDVLGRFCWRLSIRGAVLTPEPTIADGCPRDLYLGARGHPYLDLIWDEVGASACWDTGAGITVVDAAFVGRHPQFFRREATAWGTDATGASRETPTYLMQGPVIGGHRFDAHRVACVDLSAPNNGIERRIDFILGFTTLIQAEWVMDFPARRWSAELYRSIVSGVPRASPASGWRGTGSPNG